MHLFYSKLKIVIQDIQVMMNAESEVVSFIYNGMPLEYSNSLVLVIYNLSISFHFVEFDNKHRHKSQ